jgi:predicted GNAT family acetyltransferase
MGELKATIEAQHVCDDFQDILEMVEDDSLAIAAFENEVLVSAAICAEWLGDVWDMGVDTLPQYKGRGLASYLVKELAIEVEARGKLPCYSTWSANIASTKVALSAGFYPTWLTHYSVDL